MPLFPALRELLLRIRGNRSPDPTERIIPISDAKTAISTACRKAKLPHYTQHTLRHYWVSNAIEALVDFKAIAHWVRHKDGGALVTALRDFGSMRDQSPLLGRPEFPPRSSGKTFPALQPI